MLLVGDWKGGMEESAGRGDMRGIEWVDETEGEVWVRGCGEFFKATSRRW